jgi:hypothetical protein
MAGGNGTTMKVSAALRKAGLPMLRWSDAVDSLSRHGITVGSNGPSQAHVGLHFGDGRTAERREREWADMVEGVLLARGFAYTRHTIATPDGTAYSFTVYRTHEDPLYRALLAAQSAPQPEKEPQAPADPEEAAIGACGLPVAKLTRTDWQIRHGADRRAYSIKRTGTGERARYTATARDGRTIGKNLRTLPEALAAVQTDIDNQEA